MGEKRNLRCLMKLEFNSTIFEIQTEDSILTRDIQNLRPVTLTLTRSADHEYYSSLPQKAALEASGRTITVTVFP